MTNKNKKNFFKGFLATTSAFAVIAGASNSAMGAQYTTNDGGVARIANRREILNSNTHRHWAAYDSFFLSHEQNLRIGTQGALANVATLDLNNKAGINIEVENNSSIASLVDSSGNNRTAALTVHDGSTLTLGGNAVGSLAKSLKAQAAGDFSGLGDVTLASGKKVSKLTIDANATFDGTINSAFLNMKATKTVINIKAAKTVTFNGAVGGVQEIDKINLLGAGSIVIFNKDITVGTVKTANATAEIRVADGKFVDGFVDATVKGGILQFLGAGTATQEIGGSNALTLVEASGAGVVNLNDAINTATLNIKNGATVEAADNSAAAIAVINIGEVGGAGTLVIDANGKNYDLLNDTAIKFKNDDSVLKLTNTTNVGNSVVTLRGKLVPGGTLDDSKGKLDINSAGTTTLNLAKDAAETIGTDNTHRLNELIVSGNQGTTIAPDIFAKTIIVRSTADVTFAGAIDSGANSAINFTAAGNTVFYNNVTATTLAFADNARVVTVAHNKNLTANTITSGAGNGSQLVLAGDTDIVLGGAQAVAVDLITAAANGNTVNLGAGAYTVPDIQLINAGGKLKLANGFNLTGGMNVAAGNAATVTFLGNGTVTGEFGSVGNAVGAVTVAGNSTLQLGGNVNAASLDGNAANAQNVKFINAGNITVAGPVGNIQAFDQIEFNGGGRVTFGAGDLKTGQKLHFTANTEVVTNGYNLAATYITNANGINGSKLTVNVDQVITGNVSAFGAVHVDDAALAIKTVSINTANYLASVTGKLANVSFDHVEGNSSVNFLGSGANSINNADFVKDGTVLGEVHADTIDVRAGKTATFKGIVFEGSVNGMKMHANTAQADFDAKVVLNMPILANADGNGVIVFLGGAILNRDIGTAAVCPAAAIRVGRVDINGDSTINANIHSNVIRVADKNIVLANAFTFDGTTTFNGTTITLDKNDLTMTGGNVTFTGASKINTKVTANTADLGNLVAGAGSTITLGGANTLTVEVDDKAALPVNGQALKLIAKTGGGALSIDLSKVTVTATGAFSEWKKSIVADELVLTQDSQIREGINRAAKKAKKDDVISDKVAQSIKSYEKDTAGEDYVLQLNQMTDLNIADSVARINTTANEVFAVNLNTINAATNTISARIADVTSFVSLPIVSTPVISSPAVAPTVSSPATAPTTGRGTSPVKTGVGKNIKVSSENNYISGVASGDDHTRFGAWATPFYSKSTQKKRSGTSGFKADSYGGTFGVDTKANDNMVIGLAFSAMNTDIKHKDFKSGDKTKLTSFLVSAYATHQFTNNWFGQGVFSMGLSSVNNKENRRISNTQLAIAEGKYNSMMFAAEVLGGYNHVVNSKFVVTPMLGLNYNRINDGEYTESGSNAGPQLIEVTKRASQKLDVVGGIRLTAMPFMANNVEITPEAHAFVRHDVIGKGAKVDAKIPGLSLPSEKAKLQKTFYNVGASLNAAYGAMDYGVSADASFANKYVGVQGSVKVRVNF